MTPTLPTGTKLRRVLLAALATAVLGGCATGPGLQRKTFDPWSWGPPIGLHQAELVTGARQTLHIAGQTSLDAEGKVLHAGAMGPQLAQALDNLETVLRAADMRLADVVHVTIFTTDMQATLKHYAVYQQRMEAAGVKPPMSLIGVSELAFPGLVVEIEATAAR